LLLQKIANNYTKSSFYVIVALKKEQQLYTPIRVCTVFLEKRVLGTHNSPFMQFFGEKTEKMYMHKKEDASLS